MSRLRLDRVASRHHLVRVLLFIVSAHAAIAAPAWQTLSDCRLIESKGNDGDSFHVLHAGREHVFRLYYVDSPESRDYRHLTRRTRSQARYWNISKRDLFLLADEAARFTREKLLEPFTVQTQWEDAMGETVLGRAFAVVQTTEGDLGELLVAAGLARIFGRQIRRPEGTSIRSYRQFLKQIEETARQTRRGAWAVGPARTSKARSSTRAHGSWRSYSLGAPRLAAMAAALTPVNGAYDSAYRGEER